jgi:ureidoglycolate hydrolase
MGEGRELAVAARIEARRLTEEGWSPYGWLPVDDTDPADGSHRLHYEWADPHANVIGHTLGEVPVVPGGLRCQMLYRHASHTLVLMVLDHPCVLAVAPPWSSLAGPDDAGRIEAFRLEPLESLVLHRGTWHWGPFPVGGHDEVRLFNVQGLGYAEDNEMADLAGAGWAVDVVVS